jgi:hypothetical protein
MKLKRLVLLFLLFIGVNTFGQLQAPVNPQLKSQSVSLRLIGFPTWPLGFSYGQMISNRFSLEVGAGIGAMGAGFDFYMTNPRLHQFNVVTGFYGSYFYLSEQPAFCLPLGLSYHTKKNFQYILYVGMSYEDSKLPGPFTDKLSPWFGLTLSKRFGPVLDTVKKENTHEKMTILAGKAGFTFPFIGFSYERIWNRKYGLEANAGFLGASIGANAYFPALRPQKVSFKVGASTGLFLFWVANAYFPVGIQYLGKEKFVFGLDIGPQFWSNDSETLPGFSIKFGKRIN